MNCYDCLHLHTVIKVKNTRRKISINIFIFEFFKSSRYEYDDHEVLVKMITALRNSPY